VSVNVRCVDCNVDLLPDTPRGSQDWQQYMVHDDVWAAAGMRPNGGWLCSGCLQTRLGRYLTGRDLTAAPINDPGRYDDTPRLAALKLAADLGRFTRSDPQRRQAVGMNPGRRNPGSKLPASCARITRHTNTCPLLREL
jgi:hypothetical protein